MIAGDKLYDVNIKWRLLEGGNKGAVAINGDNII